MTPAYGYIRCSGIGQMDGDGPIRQRQAIEGFAASHDIQIIEWFNESHTGTDLEGRPEFRKMREMLVSDGIRTVIVERLDRLARDILVQETILADFKRNEIRLMSATPGEDDLCGTDPTRTLVRQILGIFAQYERAMIVSKLNSARARKRAKGERCEGRKPFGTLPGEQQTLDTIYQLYRNHYSTDEIARTLNDNKIMTRGVKTDYGTVTYKPWRGSVIRKILARNRNITLLPTERT